MMKITPVCVLTMVAVFFLAGCTSIQEGYKKYDPSRKYLYTEQHFSDPIEVPPTFSDNRLEEYYPVPDVALDSAAEKPELDPPSNSIKGA